MGCLHWKNCCYCKCYEFYSYRSDLMRCVGNHEDLHLGCQYHLLDGNHDHAKLKIVTLTASTNVNIGEIKVLSTHPNSSNLGSSCRINKGKSTFLYNGSWRNFRPEDVKFFIEGQPTEYYLKWYGVDLSKFEGLIIKLQINCTRAGLSCLVLKVKGTISWPDSVTNDTAVVFTDGPTKSTDEPIMVNKGERDSGKKGGIGKIGIAAVAAGAAILVVLLLVFAGCHLSRRKKRMKSERGQESQPGFSSATYEDSVPESISRANTYEKPFDPVYDDLQESVGNPLYGRNERSGSLTMPPVEENPVHNLILQREPSERSAAHSSRPLPRTPDQIVEDVANEGGYTQLSHSVGAASPLHADNPVYLTADGMVIDKQTGHNYAVLESDTDVPSSTVESKLHHGYAALKKVEDNTNAIKSAPVHDYAVLENDSDKETADADSSLLGHNYAVLENNADAATPEASTLAIPGSDNALVESGDSSSGYEKLILDSEPSPYQSLVL